MPEKRSSLTQAASSSSTKKKKKVRDAQANELNPPPTGASEPEATDSAAKASKRRKDKNIKTTTSARDTFPQQSGKDSGKNAEPSNAKQSENARNSLDKKKERSTVTSSKRVPKGADSAQAALLPELVTANLNKSPQSQNPKNDAPRRSSKTGGDVAGTTRKSNEGERRHSKSIDQPLTTPTAAEAPQSTASAAAAAAAVEDNAVTSNFVRHMLKATKLGDLLAASASEADGAAEKSTTPQRNFLVEEAGDFRTVLASPVTGGPVGGVAASGTGGRTGGVGGAGGGGEPGGGQNKLEKEKPTVDALELFKLNKNNFDERTRELINQHKSHVHSALTSIRGHEAKPTQCDLVSDDHGLEMLHGELQKLQQEKYNLDHALKHTTVELKKLQRHIQFAAPNVDQRADIGWFKPVLHVFTESARLLRRSWIRHGNVVKQAIHEQHEKVTKRYESTFAVRRERIAREVQRIMPAPPPPPAAMMSSEEMRMSIGAELY